MEGGGTAAASLVDVGVDRRRLVLDRGRLLPQDVELPRLRVVGLEALDRGLELLALLVALVAMDALEGEVEIFRDILHLLE